MAWVIHVEYSGDESNSDNLDDKVGGCSDTDTAEVESNP